MKIFQTKPDNDFNNENETHLIQNAVHTHTHTYRALQSLKFNALFKWRNNEEKKSTQKTIIPGKKYGTKHFEMHWDAPMLLLYTRNNQRKIKKKNIFNFVKYSLTGNNSFGSLQSHQNVFD